MNIHVLKEFWVKSAAEDLKTAQSLFVSKRYHHCLFFCHLFIEKILKALVVKKTKKPSPYDHNLLRLAELSGIAFAQDQLDALTEIKTFNIGGRYDDYKFSFYKKATRVYAEKYLTKSLQLYLWLNKFV